ncbi:hypothetical protein ACHQM5_023371 [Ranunculus cassubicifolius]
MARKQKYKPSFIKFMLGTSTDKLGIPSGFNRNFKGNFPKTLLLKTSSSSLGWTVKVEKIGQNMVLLGEGWKRFMEENYVEFGDILQFSLFGKSEFHVKIYDRTCCEKENISEYGAFFQNRKSKLEKEKTDQRKLDGDCDALKNKEVMDITTVHPSAGDCDVLKNKKVKDIMGMGSRVKTTSNYPDVSSILAKERKLKEKVVSEAYEQFDSVHPFFIITVSPSYIRRGFLGIATAFVKTYIPKRPKNLKIVDSKGRIWSLTCNLSIAYIGSGWNAVVEANDLKENCVCAFELINDKDIKLKLSVLNNLD